MMPHHNCPTISNATPDVVVCPALLQVSQMSALEYLKKPLDFCNTSAHPNVGPIDWVRPMGAEVKVMVDCERVVMPEFSKLVSLM